MMMTCCASSTKTPPLLRKLIEAMVVPALPATIDDDDHRKRSFSMPVGVRDSPGCRKRASERESCAGARVIVSLHEGSLRRQNGA